MGVARQSPEPTGNALIEPIHCNLNFGHEQAGAHGELPGFELNVTYVNPAGAESCQNTSSGRFSTREFCAGEHEESMLNDVNQVVRKRALAY